MAARVAAIRRFLADSGQELHETYRSQTNESPRRDLPLLGHRMGHDRIAGHARKVRLLNRREPDRTQKSDTQTGRCAESGGAWERSLPADCPECHAVWFPA